MGSPILGDLSNNRWLEGERISGSLLEKLRTPVRTWLTTTERHDIFPDSKHNATLANDHHPAEEDEKPTRPE